MEQPNLGVDPQEKEEGQEKINKRQEAMLEFLNHVSGSSLSLDIKGYEEAGRSEGIIDKLSPNEEFKDRLRIMFRTISRGL